MNRLLCTIILAAALQLQAMANAPATLTLASAQAAPPPPPVLNCGKNATAGTVSDYATVNNQVHVLIRANRSGRIVVDERLSTTDARTKYAAVHAGSAVCIPTPP